MASSFPLRLLSQTDGNFEIINPADPARKVTHFDILTYTWGELIEPYNCEIAGVSWNVMLRPQKLDTIKRLMKKEDIRYLWVDCVCINQQNETEKDAEIPKMYQYYKSARKCYILMDMGPELWNPQDIVDYLKFLSHVLDNMRGASLASEGYLSQNVKNRLLEWANNADWDFDIDVSVCRSAAVDLGVLNCYATCINRVRSLFDNFYFTRVWTFQEMLLGKNITMYGVNDKSVECIGELDTWLDLATDSKDKAVRLLDWINKSTVLKTSSVNAILNSIEEDFLILSRLQTQVRGISSARKDIITGGPYWWHDNEKGIANIFSAISMSPRNCGDRRDVFRGLLGIFNGLFTPDEVQRDLGGEDIEMIEFVFFKQLSFKTKQAWTKLAISNGDRGNCDWIPVVVNHSKKLTTDIFAGVVNLGRLKPNGLAKAYAITGLVGSPRKYMKITLRKEHRGFQFTFRGCNAGKQVKTGIFSSEPIPINDQPINVSGDETGRTLVQCATILGAIIDPGANVVQYRLALLEKLQPFWTFTDPDARPQGWGDRCVSGTGWENPDPLLFRVHNRSMNYKFGAIVGCASRLENDSTRDISCEVRVNLNGSSLGGASATLENDRIVLHDGLGLVQVGDVGKTFSLVAFGGDVDFHKSYANSCRSTKDHKPVVPKLPWPRGRAMVRDNFTHGIADAMRDYGYVHTGCGNLLICRNNPVGQYKIAGVCIDNVIENKKGEQYVTIR